MTGNHLKPEGSTVPVPEMAEAPAALKQIIALQAAKIRSLLRDSERQGALALETVRNSQECRRELAEALRWREAMTASLGHDLEVARQKLQLLQANEARISSPPVNLLTSINGFVPQRLKRGVRRAVAVYSILRNA